MFLEKNMVIELAWANLAHPVTPTQARSFIELFFSLIKKKKKSQAF